MSKNLAQKLIEDMLEDKGYEIEVDHPIFKRVGGEIAQLVIPVAEYLAKLGYELSARECLKLQIAVAQVVINNSTVQLKELILNNFKQGDDDEDNNLISLSAHRKFKLFN